MIASEVDGRGDKIRSLTIHELLDEGADGDDEGYEGEEDEEGRPFRLGWGSGKAQIKMLV